MKGSYVLSIVKHYIVRLLDDSVSYAELDDAIEDLEAKIREIVREEIERSQR